MYDFITMYNLTCDDLKLQIFNSKWTSLSKVTLDLETVVDMFNIANIDKLRVHGYFSRFKVSQDFENKIRYTYDGKQFFTLVNHQSKTFVLDEKFNAIEVLSYKELQQAIKSS